MNGPARSLNGGRESRNEMANSKKGFPPRTNGEIKKHIRIVNGRATAKRQIKNVLLTNRTIGHMAEQMPSIINTVADEIITHELISIVCEEAEKHASRFLDDFKIIE